MNAQRSDNTILVSILFMFTVSIGVLASTVQNKQTKAAQDPQLEAALETVENHAELLAYSQSVDSLARTLLQLPAATVKKFIEDKILSPESPLENHDKVEVLVALAHYYNRIKKDVPVISWLVPHTNLLEEHPLFLVAAQSIYVASIPALIAATKVQAPKLLQDWQKRSLFGAVKDNDVKALKRMHQYGIRISGSMATVLLMLVAADAQDQEFVAYLLERGADINQVVQGKTPLISAVQSNNMPMVAALLKYGANPNLMGDPAIGTPLQIAFERHYRQIEDMLREYGARG